MKLVEALDIINAEPQGYRVTFYWKEGPILRSDFFPDRDELPFTTENVAWTFATRFGEKTKGKCVDIYVVHTDFTPVEGYREKMINSMRSE